MAIRNSDGSIVLTTEVDTSGVKKGMTAIKNNSSSVMSSLDKLGKKIIAVFSVQKLLQFSLQSSKFAIQTEASVQRLIDIYGDAAKSIETFIEKNSEALAMSKSAAQSYAAVYGNLFSVWADQESNAALTTKYLNMTAVVASKTGRTMEDVQERIRSGLLGNTEAVEDLGIFVNVKTIEMSEAFTRIANGRSWEQLNAYEQSQVRALAILEQSTAKYGDTVADTASTTRARYQAAYEDFMNTWGQVTNMVLIPLMEGATAVFETLVGIFEFFGGNVTKNMDSYAGSLGNAAKNQDALAGAVGATNKEIKKSLASFDDLSILMDSQSVDATSGGSSYGFSQTDSSILESIATKTGEIKENSESTLSAWEEFAYEVVGEIAPKNFANLGNAMLSYQHSASKLASLYDFDFDATSIAATLVDWWAMGETAALTFGSGFMDAQYAFFNENLTGTEKVEGIYKSFGKMMGAALQLAPESWLENISDKIGVEITADWFLPITEDIDNVYGKLSALATKSLMEYRKAYANVSDTVTMLSWSQEVITPENLAGVQEQLDSTFGIVEGYIAENETRAVEALRDLVANGMITEEDAKALTQQTNDFYAGQMKTISENKDKINEILKKASDENRKLTAEEYAQINDLLAKSNAVAEDTYRSNVEDREQYVKELMEQEGEWDAQRLSRVIQLANDVQKKEDEAAQTKYDKSIAAAKILYYDMGAITKEEYDAMIKKANEDRDAEIRASKEKRDGIVDNAKGAAGDIANAVDTESGTILSKWEQLWNNMWEKVKNIINTIIGGINTMFRNIVTVGAGSYWEILGVEMDYSKIPEIPKLANGAVIPGGRSFLAVLGDQPKGQTNIETPLQTMVDAFNIALSQNGGYSAPTEVVLELDGREFGRAVVEQGNIENRRIGTRLVIV